MACSTLLVSCLSECPVAAVYCGIATVFDSKSIPCEAPKAYMYTNNMCGRTRVEGQHGQSTMRDVLESLAGVTHTAN